MQPAPADAENSAIDALRRGDAAAARGIFESLVVDGLGDASTRLGLAYACTALGDLAAARAAVDAALALDPRDLRSLMLKADQLQFMGQAAEAAAFYQAAASSAPQGVTLPAELEPLANRARAMALRHQEWFATQLRSHPALSGARSVSARFAMSMDVLLGSKQVYTQQPRQYYFPGLPQTQFFDRADFPWLDRVEAATDRIRQELLAVMARPEAFTPYIQRDPGRPALARGDMLDNPDWSAFFLWKNGEAVAANAARCPATMAALAKAPLTRMAGRSPSILFSLLRPGAHIPAHHGIVNTRLIVHLPLIVPPGCAFRVGNETREWVEGRAWIFDDTIEHEAWNRSDQTRVVLLFEVWRPELTLDERAQVCGLFEAIDGLRGSPGQDWEI